MSDHNGSATRPFHPHAAFAPWRGKILLVLIAAIVTAAAAAILTYRHNIGLFKKETAGGLKTLLLSFSDDGLASLTGTPADTGTRYYREIENRFARARASNPDIISIQLLRHDPATGTSICMVNSSRVAVPLFQRIPKGSGNSRVIRELAGNGDINVQFGSRDEYGRVLIARGIAALHPAPGGGVVTDYVRTEKTAIPSLAGALVSASQRALGIMIFMCLPVAVYLATRGKTRQKRMLNELIMAIEQSGTAIFIGSTDKRALYVNNGLLRQYGCTSDEASRVEWCHFCAVKPTDADSFWLALFEPGAKPRSLDHMMRRKNGEIFPARVTLTPVHDTKNNKVVSVIAVSTDLTELNKPTDQLRKAAQLAGESSRAKSTFIAMISHELRTPLNGIVGFANLLLDTPLTPQQADCVRPMRKHGETLVGLAVNILDITRLESGAARPGPRECDPLVLTVGALDAAAAKVGDKSMRFVPDIHPDAPAAPVLDAECLHHVLTNLAISAAEQIHDGTVTISLCKAPDDPGGPPALEIAVCGAGSIRLPRKETISPWRSPEDPSPPMSLMLARRLMSLLGCKTMQYHSGPGHFACVFLLQYTLPK